MKKVLIFSTAYLPLIGGAEIAIKEITDRIGGDFEFDLICARIKKDLPKREIVGRVNIYRVGWGCFLDKYYLALCSRCFAAKLHKKNNYSAIWAIMASFGGLAALKFKLKYQTIPYLLTLQEGDSPEHIASRSRWLGPYYKEMFKQADYLTAISQHLFDFGRQQGAVAPMEIVPNGVDFEKFKPALPDLNLRYEIGLTDKNKVIITVSRLVPKNGVADLIAAVAKLTIDNVKLLIVGSGPLEKTLKHQVKKLKIEDRVIFLGSAPYDEVPKYLNLAHVFARPSLSEGLGNVFLEAMACGLPVVGTLVGGIQDIFLFKGGVQHGCFDCRAGDPTNIAEKIKEIFSLSDEERQRLKIVSRGFADYYQWSNIAERMKNIFNQLIR